MFARIALFELRYQLRRPIALISFAVFALLTFGLITGAGLHPDGIPLNAPGRIAVFFGMFGILGMFLSVATIADVALRDGQSHMDAILRAQPVRNAKHYGARFAGAFVIACLCFLGVAFGYATGVSMPWVSAEAAGVFQPAAYALAFLVIALPALFATGALFFAIALLTQRLMATYLGAIVLLILVVAGSFVAGHPVYRIYAAILDPFGILAFVIDTERWSGLERLTHMIPLDGLLMWNRLLWTGIGGALLALSLGLFTTRERRPRASRIDAPASATSMLAINRPVIAAGTVGAWTKLVMRTRHETRSILRSWTFIVLLILGLLLAVGLFLIQSLIVETPNAFSTPNVANLLAAAFTLITVLLPIAYGGELIWRDRSAKIAQIIDATPASNTVFLLSKIIAVAFVIVALLAVAMASGITFQLIKGARIDVGYYLIKLSLFVGLPALMYGVLAIFIQTVVNRKFVGLLLMLALLGYLAFAPEFGITNTLLLPFTIPDPGMRKGYADVLPALWYAGYWCGIAVLLAVASHLIWVRGAGTLWTRIKHAPYAVSPAVAMVAALAILGTAASASYIHWSEHATGYSARPAVVAQN